MRSAMIQASLGILMLTAIYTMADQNNARADATTAPTTGPATTTASVINWDQASKHVGETVTVTGPVMGTHVTTGGKSLVLNIGKDYPDPSRFSVMIKLDEKNPASADDYKDKTVTVTGKIELYRKAPEIKANQADVTSAAAPTTNP